MSKTSPQIHESVQDCITSDAWRAKVAGSFERDKMIRYVNFDEENPSNLFPTKHEMVLTQTMPTDRSLILLFPCHPDPKKRILDTKMYSKLNSVNYELNERFKNSVDDGAPRVAVAYGRHIFVLTGIQGTIYLIWSEFIKQVGSGRNTNIIGYMEPLLFNLNGTFIVKNVYRFKPQIQTDIELDCMPIGKDTPKLCIYRNSKMMQTMEFFICETRPEQPSKPKLNTKSREDVVKMVSKQNEELSEQVLAEDNPFAASLDMEMEAEDFNRNRTDSFLAFESPNLSIVHELPLSAEPAAPDCGTHRDAVYPPVSVTHHLEDSFSTSNPSSAREHENDPFADSSDSAEEED